MEDSYNEYIEQLQKGSYEAFSELYSLYSNKLYSFVLAQTKNSTLSEDIVQETFLKLWKSRKQLDCYGNVHALIFTIARNLIIDGFRKQVSKISFSIISRRAISFLPSQLPMSRLLTMSLLTVCSKPRSCYRSVLV